MVGLAAETSVAGDSVIGALVSGIEGISVGRAGLHPTRIDRVNKMAAFRKVRLIAM